MYGSLYLEIQNLCVCLGNGNPLKIALNLLWGVKSIEVCLSLSARDYVESNIMKYMSMPNLNLLASMYVCFLDIRNSFTFSLKLERKDILHKDTLGNE